MSDYVAVLRSEYGGLSPGQPVLTDRQVSPGRRIADFILTEYFDAAFMSVTEASQSLGTAPGALVRFAQRLGIAGYPEFRRALIQRVKQEHDVTPSGNGQAAAPGNGFRSTLLESARAIREVLAELERPDFDRCLRQLSSNGRLLVLADYPWNFRARQYARLFAAAGKPALDTRTDPAEALPAVSDLTPADLVIYPAHLPAHPVARELVERIRASGAYLLGVASNGSLPLLRQAYFVIMTRPARLCDSAEMITMEAVLAGLYQAWLDCSPGAARQDGRAGSWGPVGTLRFLSQAETCLSREGLGRALLRAARRPGCFNSRGRLQ